MLLAILTKWRIIALGNQQQTKLLDDDQVHHQQTNSLDDDQVHHHQQTKLLDDDQAHHQCILDQVVSDLVASGVSTWYDLLPGGQQAAIYGADKRKPLSHDALKSFLHGEASSLSRCIS